MVIYLKRYHWYVSKSNSSDSKYVFSIVTFFLLTSLADRIISKRGRKFLVREKEKKRKHCRERSMKLYLSTSKGIPRNYIRYHIFRINKKLYERYRYTGGEDGRDRGIGTGKIESNVSRTLQLPTNHAQNKTESRKILDLIKRFINVFIFALESRRWTSSYSNLILGQLKITIGYYRDILGTNLTFCVIIYHSNVN